VPAITAIEPRWAVPGSRVLIRGNGFPISEDGPPRVTVAATPAEAVDARVVAASRHELGILVPDGPAGRVTIALPDHPGVEGSLIVARHLTTGLHQVDNPAFDAAGRLWVTQSGGRDAKVSVPLYRVGRTGVREPLAVEIANPTSLALGPDGAMYISSRFDGQVYRIGSDDRAEVYASELGVATGLAFAPDGSLFVGDRSGTIFRVSPEKRIENVATVPASVAAFHLVHGPDGFLYVAAPTLATNDVIYRLSPTGGLRVVARGFGRPQGLAFDARGRLYVVDALAGAAGLCRVDVPAGDTDDLPTPERLLNAPSLVGMAFDPNGGIVLASSDTIWRLDVDPE
jgi:sugar lactone lactonase YvrE